MAALFEQTVIKGMTLRNRLVRAVVGADYPVLIKLTASDNLKDSLSHEDAIYAAEKFSQVSINAIEVSAGTTASGDKNPAREKINKPWKEAYTLEFACRIKDTIYCPVMVVGGFRCIP